MGNDQSNLAVAYNDRIKGIPADNIERAIEHCNHALEVRTRQDYPRQWAMTQDNLARAYSDRIEGDPSDNLEKAIDHYQLALEVFSPNSFPNDCLRTARNLGYHYFQKHRWKETIDLLLLAKIAAEKLYQSSLFRSSKKAELAEIGSLYRDAAYSLAKVGRHLEAVITLEQSRARDLSDALARDRADLKRVRQDDLEAYELYRKAANDIRELESLERSSGKDEGAKTSFEQLRELASKAFADMESATERIRRIPGYEAFLKEPDEGDIAAAVIDDLPLVYLVITTEGSLALISTIGRSKNGDGKFQELSIKPIWLDEFNTDNVLTLLNGPSKNKNSKGWFGAYDRWLEAQELQDQDAYENAEGLWFDAIIKVTEELWDSVIGPVVDSLCSHGFTQAILIPSGYLGLLPLHAASWIEDGTRHYAMEKISFAYAPSASTLIQAMNIAKSYKGETLLAIDEPESIASALPSSQEEVNSIAAFFNNSKVLRHEKAEREKVLRILPSFQVAHFSCHGAVNRGDPDQSGLYMANDQMLTVQDLFQLNLKGARMATLSACETGVIGTKLPDEVIALPSAFMRAGFAGVVSSLWTVEDESAAILMKEFYRQWQNKGFVPIRALNEAQKGLQEDERFVHPFYWAAFYLTGV